MVNFPTKLQFFLASRREQFWAPSHFYSTSMIYLPTFHHKYVCLWTTVCCIQPQRWIRAHPLFKKIWSSLKDGRMIGWCHLTQANVLRWQLGPEILRSTLTVSVGNNFSLSIRTHTLESVLTTPSPGMITYKIFLKKLSVFWVLFVVTCGDAARRLNHLPIPPL